jgi:hypothetical protein
MKFSCSYRSLELLSEDVMDEVSKAYPEMVSRPVA